ncbi:permease prefix domain 1-containing protein [Dactylosporangium sp. NPDC050688]|uniref:permease prefix domain 1-containing protein n=1 Tax=Dactylosporangium sp. NPDC050688 TaxID=3157217 RepID=UPI0033EAC7C7
MTGASEGPASAGPIEQYLDELFDRLAGTGASGRRVLAEAESHLFAAAEDGVGRGLDAEAAEREAVARFGAAADIARQVPPAREGVRAALLRLAVGVWAVAGGALAWYGTSGVLTSLLARPWARLLVATDRFGSQPDMCGRPWVPPVEGLDCVAIHQAHITAVPAGGAGFPFAVVAVAGFGLLLALFAARWLTPLGTTAWTPARPVLGLAFAVPFGLAALLLLFYGVFGAFAFMQDWTLSYVVSGLLAGMISVAAGLRARRRAAAV